MYEYSFYVFLILLIIGALNIKRIPNKGKKRIPNKGKSILKWVLIIIIGWVIVLSIVRFNMEERFIANAKVNAATENQN